MKHYLTIAIIAAGLSACGSQTEEIDRRTKAPSSNVGGGDSGEVAEGQFLKGNDASLIECFTDKFQATQCRLLENPTIIAEATEEIRFYQIDYEFNCSSGVFDSGLRIKSDTESTLSISLKTDTKESILVEGKGPFLIEANDPESFSSEVFNVGCHLLVNATLLP